MTEEVYSRVIIAEEHRQVRLVVNEFRGEEYLHFREYYLGFEEEWLPTNKGLSIPLEVDSTKEMLIALCEVVSLAESRQVIEEFFGDIIIDIYSK